jgi:5-bromo-4-chloroindolyl phosphate hydrolysis protein
MTKNNKSAAGGPKNSAPTTLDTLFNTLQALVNWLDKIEALSKESSLKSEVLHHSMEFLNAQLEGLAKQLEQMKKTLGSNSIHSLDIQTNAP